MIPAFVSDGETRRGADRPARGSGIDYYGVPKRPQVLLVEDNAALARTMRWAVLARCEVTPVGTVREAEECLGHDWDAFIFDISLPDGSGLALMRKARERQPGAGALVISGLDREGDPEAAFEMGARYLAKPFTPADILKFLEECLPRAGVARGDEDVGTRMPSVPPVPDVSESGETADVEGVALIPPFPPEVAKLVAQVKVSGVHATTAESELAYRLALLARAVAGGGPCAANIDACAKGAGVSRQTLQDFATLTSRWEPDRIADLLSMTDRSGRPITRAVLLKVARGSGALRSAFEERLAKGELDLGALAREMEQRKSQPPR